MVLRDHKFIKIVSLAIEETVCWESLLGNQFETRKFSKVYFH